ncbi:MAG: hypothetical protein GKR89_30000 [Candidatus Latescibacteria bacterium]|nr:hypothetical protein [Candidatus Latescibacterota bacterium]
MALYRIGVIVLCAGWPALAHFPEGITYQVFQFPDGHVPAMDGDLADWAVVPQAYIAGPAQHEQVMEGASAVRDTADHHIKRAMVGWNDTLNRLYFAAEIYDDSHRFSKENTDSLDTYYSRWKGAYVHGADIWEIVIDADEEKDKFDAFWSLSKEMKMYCMGEYLVDFRLMPVEENLFKGK